MQVKPDVEKNKKSETAVVKELKKKAKAAWVIAKRSQSYANSDADVCFENPCAMADALRQQEQICVCIDLVQ